MNIQEVSISVTSSSEKLSGLLYIPQYEKNAKLPSVVIFHGRGSSKDRYKDRGEALAAMGILTLIFDFRGCGKSDGDFSEQTIAMGFIDACAGFEFLRNHPLCDKTRLGILGGSFGGYQAALLLNTYSISSAILSAPAIYQDKWWDMTPESIDPKRKGLYTLQSGFEQTKAIGSVRKYKGKILIIEHENDEVIPKRVTKAYWQSTLQAKVREKKIILGAPHALHDRTYIDQSVHVVVKWFIKTL